MNKNPKYNLPISYSRPIDERIAVLEMLLWKYHIQPIPKDVFERLIKNGFLVKSDIDNTYGWAKITDDLGQSFNEIFHYA